jgi:hypothetical protein
MPIETLNPTYSFTASLFFVSTFCFQETPHYRTLYHYMPDAGSSATTIIASTVIAINDTATLMTQL